MKQSFPYTGADFDWVVSIQLKMLLFMCQSTEHGPRLDILSSSAVNSISIWVQGSQNQE